MLPWVIIAPLEIKRLTPQLKRSRTQTENIMAGLDKHTPAPTEIKLHQRSRLLEVSFSDGNTFKLPFEYLRVYSPSAEVRGHGAGQETLQTGKRDVDIAHIESVGNYAILPFFSDGHDSGIYSWDLLYQLGVNQGDWWADYLYRLDAAGASRDIDSTNTIKPPAAGGCGSSAGGGGGCGGGSCGSH